MKFLLLFVLALIVVWWWRTGRKLPPESGKTRRSWSGRRPLEMVRCAHCGVHVPLSDAVATRTAHYCSVEHRRIAEP